MFCFPLTFVEQTRIAVKVSGYVAKSPLSALMLGRHLDSGEWNHQTNLELSKLCSVKAGNAWPCGEHSRGGEGEVGALRARALHAGGRGAEGPGGGPRGHPHLGHAALLLLTGYQKTCLHFRDSGVCISDYVANL